VNGSDAAMDQAIALHQPMMDFLRQDMFEAASMQDSVASMQATLEPGQRQPA